MFGSILVLAVNYFHHENSLAYYASSNYCTILHPLESRGLAARCSRVTRDNLMSARERLLVSRYCTAHTTNSDSISRTHQIFARARMLEMK